MRLEKKTTKYRLEVLSSTSSRTLTAFSKAASKAGSHMIHNPSRTRLTFSSEVPFVEGELNFTP